MLLNKDIFVKAYHNRVYSYSSGTKFGDVVDDLQHWMDTLKGRRQQLGNTQPDPVKALKRLEDVNGLHEILASTIINFMKAKPQPYLTNALASKDDFWKVKPFKRAMTFVFLLRLILDYLGYFESV